jgi:predicted transcriptional regulator
MDKLDELVARIRTLPRERQDGVIAFIEQFVEEPVYVMSPEEERLVQEGLDDLAAGRTIPIERMDDVWNRLHRSAK